MIVRATALALLRHYPGEETRRALMQAISDPEALIRHTALSQFAYIAPDQRIDLLTDMLYDPVTAVRMEAANQTTANGRPDLPPETQAVFQSALFDYQSAMTYSADFLFGRFNLGNLFSNLKKTDQAMKQYRAAINIDPQFYPAKVNLAMLYNQIGNNSDAERLFRDALSVRADLYEAHYSLGLLLAEEKRYGEAAGHLATAAQGMPNYARVHYNAGQLWDYLDDADKAQMALERANRLDPDNPDYIKALVQHYIKHHKHADILRTGERLMTQDPQNPLGRQLLQIAERIKQTGK